MLPTKKGQSWLPSIFNDVLDSEWLAKVKEASPAVNIMECDKRYRVEIATPGLTKDDFILEIKNENQLEITMQKKAKKVVEEDTSIGYKQDAVEVKTGDESRAEPVETAKGESVEEKEKPMACCQWAHELEEDRKHGKYLRKEFSYSHYRQTLILPDNVDKTKISAKQENGILTIIIPKKDSYIEAQATKKINIE